MESHFSQFMQDYTQRCTQNRSQSQQLPLQQATPPDSAPPPYSASFADDNDDSDSDSDSDSDEGPTPRRSPIKLIINAAHSIQGSNNLIPTSATPLADASKFSTLLLHAVNQINSFNSHAPAPAPATTRGSSRRRRTLKVDVTINCGLTVVGDRNVIGNVGLKPRCSSGTIAGPSATTTAATAVAAASSTVAGAKRKAEEAHHEDGNGAVVPASKRVAVEDHRES